MLARDVARARLEVVSGSRVAVVAELQEAAGAKLEVVADRGGGGGGLAESAVANGSRVVLVERHEVVADREGGGGGDVRPGERCGRWRSSAPTTSMPS